MTFIHFLSSLQTLIYTPHSSFSFKFTTSFLLIVLVLIYAYMHRYILKYRLFSLYNVTCMNVFRVGHLVLANQLVYSFLGTVLSPVT